MICFCNCENDTELYVVRDGCEDQGARSSASKTGVALTSEGYGSQDNLS
jgi:hypothetical protein